VAVIPVLDDVEIFDEGRGRHRQVGFEFGIDDIAAYFSAIGRSPIWRPTIQA
jgi:hypothetical protein